MAETEVKAKPRRRRKTIKTATPASGPGHDPGHDHDDGDDHHHHDHDHKADEGSWLIGAHIYSIRNALRQGTHTEDQLAVIFSVSSAYIIRVRDRVVWKDLP